MQFPLRGKNCILLALICLSTVIKYYHSFFSREQGYASGDAYGLILNSIYLEEIRGNYLIPFAYRSFCEITQLNWFNFAYIYTSILSTVLLICVFIILEKNVSLIVATVSCILIVTNPRLALYSTEPSKAIFVLFFFLFSLFFLFRYISKNSLKELFLSCAFISLAIAFYHSALFFVPAYLLIFFWTVKKHNKDPLRCIKSLMVLMFLCLALITGPVFLYNFEESIPKPGYSNEYTEIGKMSLFERYIGAVLGVISNPENSGLAIFLSGIDDYLSFGFLGLILAVYMLFIIIGHFKGLYQPNLLIEFLMVFSVIFVLISIQWKSASHWSRYPQYVIVFLLIIFGYLIADVFQCIRRQRQKFLKLATGSLIVFMFIILTITPMYALKPVDGLRNIYVPQMEVGELAQKNNLVIDVENQVLYLGWPAITISLLDRNICPEYLHTFGWGGTNLSFVTCPEYIERNHIKYYVYDSTGTDYHDSANVVLSLLKDGYKLSLIAKTSRDDIYEAIYEIKY